MGTMFVRLALLFTIVPLIELYFLIKVGGLIGVGATIAVVVGTGLLGAWLARLQGLKVLKHVQTNLEAGQVPTDALVDGMLILVAAAVLLTPGMLTDAAGFFLLIPQGRTLVRSVVRRIMAKRQPDTDQSVIDVEWHREE